MNNSFYKNMSWMGLSTILRVVLQIIFMAIMARYISPSEYGIFAIVLAIISFGQLISDAGIGSALIQRKRIGNKEISTAFFVSLILGSICFFLLFLSASCITNYYELQQLEPVIQVLSSIFFIKSIAVVSEALLLKNMNFKYIAKRDITSYIVGYLLCGLPFAVLGFGVWALVFTMLTQEIVRTIFVIIGAKQKFKISDFSFTVLKSFLYYTSGITISGIFNKIATNLDSIMIGKILGVEVLGNYSRAYQLMAYPANMFGVIVSKVFFPALADVKDDKKKLKKAFYTVISQMSLLLIPASVLLYTISSELVILILGSKWEDAIPIFEILSIGIYFRVGYKINGVIARAAGHVYKLVFVQFIYACLIAASCYFGSQYSITTVAQCIVITLLIQFSMKTIIGIYITKLKLNDFFMAYVPGFVATLIYIIFYLVLNHMPFYGSIINVAMSSFFYFLSIILTIYVFRKKDEMKVFLSLMNKFNLVGLNGN